MRLKLASRKSDLARWQAVLVARAFERLAERPQIEFIFKASKGDQDLDTELSKMGAKGVFTEDLSADLTSGVCDLVVHSWKDLPVEDRADTRVALTLERADVRDILLVPEEVWRRAEESGRLEVLTSSPRRIYNLQSALPDLLPARVALEFVPVRGNVPTRLRKMRDQGRALVIAKAGLDRLLSAEAEGFLTEGVSVRALVADCRFLVLPLRLNPPAPAQGALALEIRREDEAMNALCARLGQETLLRSVEREREVLRRHGGGCHQKIGATILPKAHGILVCVRGLTDAGEVLNEWKLETSTPWAKAKSRQAVFPVSREENPWFDREILPLPTDLHARPSLFFSRADALPEGFRPGPRQIVWTAGLATWRKLAKLGVWVNGSSEGLGESEDPRLETLTGVQRWTRLTHTHAKPSPGRDAMDTLVTYRLKPRGNTPDLKGKTHFYWTSSTAFERARQLFPREIASGFHAAGPGGTFHFLSGVQGLKHPPKAFVDLDQFLAETLP